MYAGHVWSSSWKWFDWRICLKQMHAMYTYAYYISCTWCCYFNQCSSEMYSELPVHGSLPGTVRILLVSPKMMICFYICKFVRYAEHPCVWRCWSSPKWDNINISGEWERESEHVCENFRWRVRVRVSPFHLDCLGLISRFLEKYSCQLIRHGLGRLPRQVIANTRVLSQWRCYLHASVSHRVAWRLSFFVCSWRHCSWIYCSAPGEASFLLSTFFRRSCGRLANALPFLIAEAAPRSSCSFCCYYTAKSLTLFQEPFSRFHHFCEPFLFLYYRVPQLRSPFFFCRFVPGDCLPHHSLASPQVPNSDSEPPLGRLNASPSMIHLISRASRLWFFISDSCSRQGRTPECRWSRKRQHSYSCRARSRVSCQLEYRGCMSVEKNTASTHSLPPFPSCIPSGVQWFRPSKPPTSFPS